MKYSYSTWQRTQIQLSCGHGPTEFDFGRGVGYCPKCEKWIAIDHDASLAAIRRENKRMDEGPARIRKFSMERQEENDGEV